MVVLALQNIREIAEAGYGENMFVAGSRIFGPAYDYKVVMDQMRASLRSRHSVNA